MSNEQEPRQHLIEIDCYNENGLIEVRSERDINRLYEAFKMLMIEEFEGVVPYIKLYHNKES